jgi:hypothetical protein
MARRSTISGGTLILILVFNFFVYWFVVSWEGRVELRQVLKWWANCVSKEGDLDSVKFGS